MSEIIQNYAQARTALDGLDATKLFTFDGNGKFEKETEVLVGELYSQHEQKCLTAAAKSLETGTVIETL